MDLLQCAIRILRDNPEHAEPLFDLLICARAHHSAVIEAELDDVEDFIFSKTPHGAKRKESYKKSRMEPKVKPITAEIPI